MTRATRRILVVPAVLALACGKAAPANDEGPPVFTPPDAEAPVAIDPDPPVQYPPALYDRKVEGDVMLRLFVDSTGRLIPESTRVAESSGYAALDSAAVAGVAQLRFAPARRRGIPVATSFLQPIEFRHPEGAALKGEP